MANLLGSIGASKPVTGLIDTMLKFKEVQSQAAFREQEAQNLQVREQMMRMQLEEAKKEQEELHRMRPFESSVLYQLTPEEHRQQLLEIVKNGGYLDDKGMMSKFQRDKMMNESKEFAPFFLNAQLMKEQANVDKAMSALDKAQETGDPVKTAQAENALRFRLAKIESLKGAHDKVSSILGIGKDDIKTFGGHATIMQGGKRVTVQPVMSGGKVGNMEIGEAPPPTDQMSMEEQRVVVPRINNALKEFENKVGRKATTEEQDQISQRITTEWVREKARMTAPITLIGSMPGQPGKGIAFGGRAESPIVSEIDLPGGGMVPRTQEPLPANVQEDIISSFQGLDLLQTLRNTVGESGRVKGLWSKAGAWVGTNEQAIQFNTSRQQMWLMAQSAVKGIPSDKDMSMVMNSVPELWQPETVNRARIDTFDRIFRNSISARISMYKGTNKIIPPEISALAKSKGINVDKVQPWDQVSPFNLLKGVDLNKVVGSDKKSKWITDAKAKNPSVSEQELSDYYDSKYGGQ